MNWRTGLHKGRSHILFALALMIAGAYLVHLDDKQLAQNIGQPCKVSQTAKPCAPSEKPRP